MYLECPKVSESKKIEILYDRSRMLAETRQFFQKRDIVEVDCPIISPFASVAEHIDLIPVMTGTETRYLHSSPEYGMKRLLSEGIGDIYQLSHVFRAGEQGTKHNPEFTMVEWYLVGSSFQKMIEETVELIRLFLGNLPFEILSYREAFQRYVGFDYVHASDEKLRNEIIRQNIQMHRGLEQEKRDELLNLLLATLVEPHLGTDGRLTVLSYYPASQAALSKTYWDNDEHVAERFEVYFNGLELANGYHELTDFEEQRQRFHEDNKARQRLGKDPLPIDENFLKALEKGLPDCCGVAVGFDRLMMLRHQTTIDNVIPFSWNNA